MMGLFRVTDDLWWVTGGGVALDDDGEPVVTITTEMFRPKSLGGRFIEDFDMPTALAEHVLVTVDAFVNGSAGAIALVGGYPQENGGRRAHLLDRFINRYSSIL